MTLSEAFARYDQELVVQGKTLKTRKNYRTALNSLLKSCSDIPVELVSFDMVTRWQMQMSSYGMQQSSIKSNLCKLREVFKYLRRSGQRVIDSRDIDLPKIARKDPVWLDYSEIRQLLSVIECARDKAIVAALFDSGARVSELLQLNRNSIHDGQAYILGKGDKPGTLYFSRNSLELIDVYLKGRRDKLKPLFISGQYRRITVSRVQQLLHQYSDMAGIDKNVTPHTLRHSFASDLILNGADIYATSKLLRHKNITTTQIYTHIKEKHNRENYLKYHSK